MAAIGGDNASDIYAAQKNLNQVTADLVTRQEADAKLMGQAGLTAADLQSLQLDIANLGRGIDAVQQAMQKLEKSAEDINKFIAAQ